LILLGYLVFFFFVVSGYEKYSDNVYLVALAGVSLAALGLVAWVWSVQGKKDGNS
jgi:general stress protein CsbA